MNRVVSASYSFLYCISLPKLANSNATDRVGLPKDSSNKISNFNSKYIFALNVGWIKNLFEFELDCIDSAF